MKVYPAVDILNGKCVRLVEGRINTAQVYFDNPIEAAVQWEQKGAKQLHVIDLDGAFVGAMKNQSLIEELIASVKVPVQIGGGIRTIEMLESLLNMGAARVIIGTSAVIDERFLEKCAASYADRVIVSIDSKNGCVAIDGWVNVSRISAYNFASKIVSKGLKNIIYTDISRDGTMRGPNIYVIEKLCSIEGAKVTVAGGIADKEDLNALKEIGAAGAIIGKALYNKSLILEEIASGGDYAL